MGAILIALLFWESRVLGAPNNHGNFLSSVVDFPLLRKAKQNGIWGCLPPSAKVDMAVIFEGLVAEPGAGVRYTSWFIPYVTRPDGSFPPSFSFHTFVAYLRSVQYRFPVTYLRSKDPRNVPPKQDSCRASRCTLRKNNIALCADFRLNFLRAALSTCIA